MALFDGKNFKGTLGNISFRLYDENRSSVQQNPGKGNVKQTANTKKSAALFGRLVSPFAKHIRFHFKGLVNDFADRQMVNRMNSNISIIINQHLDYDGQIVFNADSFNRLKGFEFNTNSPLVNSLLVMPTVTIENNTLQVNFPSFRVNKALKFPDRTDKVIIQLQFVFFDLQYGRGHRAKTFYFNLAKTDTSIAETFSYDFPVGTVAIVGIGLLFSSSLISIQDKQFNPAGICAAIYNEGMNDGSATNGWYSTGFKVGEDKS